MHQSQTVRFNTLAPFLRCVVQHHLANIDTQVPTGLLNAQFLLDRVLFTNLSWTGQTSESLSRASDIFAFLTPSLGSSRYGTYWWHAHRGAM